MATTLSIVAVFVPVAFMGGIIGRFFFQFGLTVAWAVLVSLFVSFTLTPMLSAWWGVDPHVTGAGTATSITRAHRALQHVVRPAGGPVPRRHQAGRSATASRRSRIAGGALRRRVHAVPVHRRRLHAGHRQLGVRRAVRDAGRLEPRVHAREGRADRRRAARARRAWTTPTRPSAPARPAP